jgi:dihydrofolate synthase/folylpolyglutamate synthase
MNMDDAMAWLAGLDSHGVILGLDRIRLLMQQLGDPHRRFPSIHIAGTNGKGSTATFLAAVLQEAGFRTGLYTSPHLSRFTERIKISGVEIAEEQVTTLAERLRAIIRSAPETVAPTYFEVTTAMAFAYFGEQQVDYAVVETGLGGRLDATNLLNPLFSVITNVAMEHTDCLGDTLEQIAREKGGIIKAGVGVLTAAAVPEALDVLRELCARQGSRLVRVGGEIRPEAVVLHRGDGSRCFDYVGRGIRWPGLRVNMLGDYQVENATLALGVVEGLIANGAQIPEDAVRRGLAAARWPGRLEMISTEPRILLDGAHNPHAAHALRRALENDLSFDRLTLVLGILHDKDIPAVAEQLLPLADQLILTRPAYIRGEDPHRLARRIPAPRQALHVCEHIPEAVGKALSLYRRGDLIVITGSLYTVGEARDYILSQENPSFQRS